MRVRPALLAALAASTSIVARPAAAQAPSLRPSDGRAGTPTPAERHAAPDSARAVAERAADAPTRPAPAAPAGGRAESPPEPPRRPAPSVVQAGPVTFTGELRSRSELAQPGGALRADGYTFVRSRLTARTAVRERLRVVLGLQSNRQFDAHPAAGSEASLDVFEGYLELRAAPRGLSLAARVGRQELALANERLIGRRNWSNTKFSFDGVRVLLAPPARPGAAAWSVTAFAVAPADRSRPAGAPPGPQPRIAGIDAVRPLARLTGATLEGFVVHDLGARARGRTVDGRTTIVGRVRAPRVGHVGLDVEGALQGGAIHTLPTATAAAGPRESIRAWMLGARVTTPASPVRRVTASLGADLLSGDTRAGDGRYGAFDTLYGSNHGFYGVADIAGGNPANTLRTRGLADVVGSTTFAATRRVSLRADVHRMTPMHGGGVLAWESDFLAPIRLAPGLTMEAGYSLFRAGAAGRALELGPAHGLRRWGYLQVTAGF